MDQPTENPKGTGTGRAVPLAVGIALGFLAARLLFPAQPASTTVPRLAGLSRHEALQALARADLVGAPGYRPARGAAPGHVAPGSQSVPAGTEVQPLSVITFTVSIARPKPRPVPAGPPAPVPLKLPPIRLNDGPVPPPPPPHMPRMPDLPVFASLPAVKSAQPARKSAPARKPARPVLLAAVPASAAPAPSAAFSPAATNSISSAAATLSTPPPSASPPALAFLEPLAGQEIHCPSQGDCDVTVRGTMATVVPADGRVVLWWRPAAGGTIWFAQLLDKVQREADDTWKASLRIGNASYTPRDGDSIDLAVTVADHETVQRLTPKVGPAFSVKPEGDQAAVVSKLVIRTG